MSSQRPPTHLPPPRPEDRIASEHASSLSRPNFTYGKLAIVAAMPVAAALALGFAAAVLLTVAAEDVAGVSDTLRGTLILMSLGLGSSIRIDASFEGSGAFTILPLLVVVVGAWLVYRFASRPVQNPVVVVVGTLMTTLIWLLVAALLSITQIEIGFGESVRSSPAAVSVVGGAFGCWAGGYVLARFATARRFLLVLTLWSAAAWLAATIAVVRIDDLSVAETIAAAYLAAMVSVNAAVLALYWVFLGKIGLTVDGFGGVFTELLHEFGANDLSFGFFSAAEEDGWLWLVGLVVVAGLVGLAWITPQPVSRHEMVRRAGALATGIFGLLWVAHVTGSPRITGDLFEVGSATATLGMITVPWGLLIPAALATGVWAVSLWMVAYQRGAGWATMPDLNNPQARSVADTAFGRAFSGMASRLNSALRELAQTPPPGSVDHDVPPPPGSEADRTSAADPAGGTLVSPLPPPMSAPAQPQDRSEADA